MRVMHCLRYTVAHPNVGRWKGARLAEFNLSPYELLVLTFLYPGY